MAGQTVRVASRDGAGGKGGAFDCYVATPASGGKVPAVVLGVAIHGVDADIVAIADEFAAHGYIAAAPDLFWRWLPGPLATDDKRAAERAQPRGERIRAGEADMADTLAYLRALPQANGRAVAMGFCYGGPYAVIGPRRLGFDGGISCHGSRMQDYLGEMEGVTQPVCLVWGDADHAAPAEVLEAYRDATARMASLELKIFPGVLHGFMMRHNANAFDQEARDFSMRRAMAMLGDLR